MRILAFFLILAIFAGSASAGDVSDELYNEAGERPMVEIDIIYEIGGRKVSLDQFGDELEKAIMKQIAEKVRQTLASVRCPEHGQRPRRVTIKGADIDNLSLEVEGCCEKLIEAAKNKLK